MNWYIVIGILIFLVGWLFGNILTNLSIAWQVREKAKNGFRLCMGGRLYKVVDDGPGDPK